MIDPAFRYADIFSCSFPETEGCEDCALKAVLEVAW